MFQSYSYINIRITGTTYIKRIISVFYHTDSSLPIKETVLFRYYYV